MQTYRRGWYLFLPSVVGSSGGQGARVAGEGGSGGLAWHLLPVQRGLLAAQQKRLHLRLHCAALDSQARGPPGPQHTVVSRASLVGSKVKVVKMWADTSTAFQVWSWESWCELQHKCQVNQWPHTPPHRHHPRPQEHNPFAGKQVWSWCEAEGYSGEEGVAIPGMCHAIRCLPDAGSSSTGSSERSGRGWKNRHGPATIPPPPPPLLLRIPGSQATRHLKGQKVVIVGSIPQTQISEPVSGSADLCVDWRQTWAIRRNETGAGSSVCSGRHWWKN